MGVACLPSANTLSKGYSPLKVEPESLILTNIKTIQHIRNSAVISSVRFVLGLETFGPLNARFKLKGLDDFGSRFAPRVYISEVA